MSQFQKLVTKNFLHVQKSLLNFKRSLIIRLMDSGIKSMLIIVKNFMNQARNIFKDLRSHGPKIQFELQFVSFFLHLFQLSNQVWYY